MTTAPDPGSRQTKQTAEWLDAIIVAVDELHGARDADDAVRRATESIALVGFRSIAVWCIQERAREPRLVGRPSLCIGPNMAELAAENQWSMDDPDSPHVGVIRERRTKLVPDPVAAGWRHFKGVSQLRHRPQALVPVATSRLDLGVLQIGLDAYLEGDQATRAWLDAVALLLAMTVEGQQAREELQADLRHVVNSVRVADFDASTTTVVHQFRHKIRALSGQVATWINDREIGQNKGAREALGRISKELDTWSVLVNTRLERFRTDTKPAQNRLTELIRDSCKIWEARASNKGCRLRPLAEHDTVSVYAPAASVREILACLIQNAIEARARFVEFEILSNVEDDRFVELRVKDNGVGISPEAEARMFSFGYTSKGERGTGMGMVIVDFLVRSIGGEIQLLSPGQAAGEDWTIFSLRLPRRAALD